MSVLEQYLLDTDETAEKSHREGFRVDSLETAEWCMRKLAQLQADSDSDNEMAEKEIERIRAWQEERNKPRIQSREFFENLLMQFHRETLERDDKAKTIKLPHGQLKARKLQDKVTYDDALIIAWAKEQGRENEFVRVKEESIKTAVKAAFTKDGESIPGVMVESQGIGFSVEVSV